jgi:hypothetical protein
MTKKKKLAKNALNHPEDFSFGELAYFKRWLEERKRRKALQKRSSKDDQGKGENPEN